MRKAIKLITSAGLLALILLTFITCRKDNYRCLLCDKCENFPEPGGGISTIKQLPFQKHAPCFNPNNNNEFIYVKEENQRYQLIKFNLQSRTETVLLDNTIIVGQPKWSKNGWIVFSKLDLQVYLMKENGDSIRQITTFFENIYPSFLGNDKIFLSVGTETSPGAGGNKIIDWFGNRIDSLKASDLGGSFGINAINSNQIIASWICDNQSNCSIKYFDMGTKNFHSVHDFKFSGRNLITGIIWHPNNEDIYFTMVREGLFKVNKNSKKVVKVRNGCDSRSYLDLSLSPDGQKILVERVDATDYKNTTGSWTEEAKIYIMDINGDNERNVFE